MNYNYNEILNETLIRLDELIIDNNFIEKVIDNYKYYIIHKKNNVIKFISKIIKNIIENKDIDIIIPYDFNINTGHINDNTNRIIYWSYYKTIYPDDINTNDLNLKLRKCEQRGMFIPLHDSSHLIASIFFCNNLSALETFKNFVESSISFSNEMELLSEFARSYSDLVWVLPSLASETIQDYSREIEPLNMITSAELGGVVDPAQLGQWISGIDPRNVPVFRAPTNKFVDAPNNLLLNFNQLNSLFFKITDD